MYFDQCRSEHHCPKSTPSTTGSCTQLSAPRKGNFPSNANLAKRNSCLEASHFSGFNEILSERLPYLFFTIELDLQIDPRMSVIAFSLPGQNDDDEAKGRFSILSALSSPPKTPLRCRPEIQFNTNKFQFERNYYILHTVTVNALHASR